MKPLDVLDSSSPTFPDWLHDFKLAMLTGQIQEARAAVFARLKAKAERPPGILERIELNDAICLLRLHRA